MKQKEFNIPFSGLKQGKHEFKYEIENTFFDSFGYDEFNSTNIDVTVLLNKTSTMMELEFEASGTVNVDCDITSEPYDQEIAANLELIVKFGEDYNDENDEILILPHGEHQVNIAQYIYEMLVLAVPQKRIHPGIEDGTLQSPILDKLRELEPKETKTENKENDPRWDELKKLLTDK
ncbi:YceD family protein [Maribacter sp. 2210JD10-5]|uniref:YceD family protein n=1 Tax=Maribacter sp. 2210JD10-5 TaxID=3386272 RepID=UPI0039BC6890